MPPLVDASGETEALRGLSLSHSWSLDGSAWSRRGTMTYPRIPTKMRLDLRGEAHDQRTEESGPCNSTIKSR